MCALALCVHSFAFLVRLQERDRFRHGKSVVFRCVACYSLFRVHLLASFFVSFTRFHWTYFSFIPVLAYFKFIFSFLLYLIRKYIKNSQFSRNITESLSVLFAKKMIFGPFNFSVICRWHRIIFSIFRLWNHSKTTRHFRSQDYYVFLCLLPRWAINGLIIRILDWLFVRRWISMFECEFEFLQCIVVLFEHSKARFGASIQLKVLFSGHFYRRLSK